MFYDPTTKITYLASERTDDVPESAIEMSEQDYADMRWQDISDEQVVAAIVAAVDKLIATTAKSLGYDSIISASSYVTSGVPQFAAESAALIAWRDAVWTAAIAAQAEQGSKR